MVHTESGGVVADEIRNLSAAERREILQALRRVRRRLRRVSRRTSSAPAQPVTPADRFLAGDELGECYPPTH